MQKNRNKKLNTVIEEWGLPCLLSFLYAFCAVFGRHLEREGSIPYGSGRMWCLLLILAVFGCILIRLLWKKDLPIRAAAGSRESDGRFFAGIFLVLLLCYLPVFLAVYPGFFVYDAQDELLQVVTRNFTTHHPLLHVLLLGGMISLVHKVTGSYNLGIAAYTVCQMLVLAGIYTAVITRLKQEGMKKLSLWLLTFYTGLFPTIVMFTLCSAKDGLFAGALLAAAMLLREMVMQGRTFWNRKLSVLILAASCVGMMLLRHNGFYAFIVFAVFKLALSFGRRQDCRKRETVLFAGILIAYLLLNQMLTAALSAAGGEHQEILTVPIQQLARVYHMEEETLTKQEKELLTSYLPEQALRRYNPKVSDGVKIDFNNRAYEEDRAGFIRLWLKVGLKHPLAYLNAWFMTSYGFWYPGAVIDVYRGNTVFTFTYEDSSYFGYEVEEPGERKSFLPPLDTFYRWLSLDAAIQKIPVLSLLFAPGFCFWLYLFLLGRMLYRGQGEKCVPYVLPLLIWLTVLFGPTYLVRYVIYLWLLIPVLLWDALKGEKI